MLTLQDTALCHNITINKFDYYTNRKINIMVFVKVAPNFMLIYSQSSSEMKSLSNSHLYVNLKQ